MPPSSVRGGVPTIVRRFRRSRCSSRCAFTLVELLVALATMAVLFALALPPFVAIRDPAAVHAAVGDAGATFSLARQTAVARRAMVAVVIDTGAGDLIVRSVAGPV